MENKFETKESELYKGMYGCYNNDMKCFQYVYEWNGATHSDYGVAMLMTKQLNEKYEATLTNKK